MNEPVEPNLRRSASSVFFPRRSEPSAASTRDHTVANTGAQPLTERYCTVLPRQPLESSSSLRFAQDHWIHESDSDVSETDASSVPQTPLYGSSPETISETRIKLPNRSAAERRHRRWLQSHVFTTPLFLRRFVHTMSRHQRIGFGLLCFFVAIELALIAVYVAETYDVDIGGVSSLNGSRVIPHVRWGQYSNTERSLAFYVRVALTFVSCCELILIYILDCTALVVLAATNAYQMGIFLASLSDGSTSRMYVPMFLRVWVLRSYVRLVIDAAKLSRFRNPHVDVMRVLASSLTTFVASVVTFACTFQISERFQGFDISFVESLYLMFVTFSTIGYGDITPSTRSGKLLMMFFIFTFVAQLPGVLANLKSTAEYLRSVQSYQNRGERHLIVTGGSPTYKEIVTILNEMLVFTDNMTLVLAMFSPITDRMRRLERHPRYRNRIKLLHFESVHDPLLVSRCQAKVAEAIVILTDKRAFGAHGDYQTMLMSRIFDRSARDVPQIVLQRYGTHTSLLRSHHTVLVLDILKKALLASALLMPGILPFLVNLVRVAGSEMDRSPSSDCLWRDAGADDWRQLYRYSRRQRVHRLTVPRSVVGRSCREVTVALARHTVTLVGVIHVSGDGGSRLDLAEAIRDGDALLIIADLNLDLHALEADFEVTLNELVEGCEGSPRTAAETASPLGQQRGDSFYPFARTMGTASCVDNMEMGSFSFGATVSGDGGFGDLVTQLLGKYTFINPTPQGVDLSRLPLDGEDMINLTALFSRYDAAADNRDEGMAESIATEINQRFDAAATAYLTRLLEEERRRRQQFKDGVEQFVLIDQSTCIAASHTTMSEFDRRLVETVGEQALIVMMQCIRSIYSKSSMTLLTVRQPSSELQATWQRMFDQPLRWIRGQGTQPTNVEHALRTNRLHASVRGVLIYCSQQGAREYEDIPILAAEKHVSAVMRLATDRQIMDPMQERHVIVELRTFTSCMYLEPKHTDPEWLREGEDHFQSALPFMMGKCFSADMLQTAALHDFFLRPTGVLKWIESILNVSVDDANVELFQGENTNQRHVRPRTRFKFYGNHVLKLKTYGDALRFLISRRSSVAIGVFRKFPVWEQLPVGGMMPRYFVTNPSSTMPLRDDDVVYGLFAGSTMHAPEQEGEAFVLQTSDSLRRDFAGSLSSCDSCSEVEVNEGGATHATFQR